MRMSTIFAGCREAGSRLCVALTVAAVLTGAPSSAALAERAAPRTSTGAARAEVVGALLALNNLIEAISQSDACRGRSDIGALGPLQDRIAKARLRAAKLLPEQTSIVEAGDSDWVCDRSKPDRASSPSALRKQAGRSIDRLEAALDGVEGKAANR